MEIRNRYRLKLYVTGGTSSGNRAVEALRKLTERLAGLIQSEVIDILTRPELIFYPGLQPEPVIVRELPAPRLEYRGRIEDPDEIMRALGIRTD